MKQRLNNTGYMLQSITLRAECPMDPIRLVATS